MPYSVKELGSTMVQVMAYYSPEPMLPYQWSRGYYYKKNSKTPISKANLKIAHLSQKRLTAHGPTIATYFRRKLTVWLTRVITAPTVWVVPGQEHGRGQGHTQPCEYLSVNTYNTLTTQLNTMTSSVQALILQLSCWWYICTSDKWSYIFMTKNYIFMKCNTYSWLGARLK